MSFLWAHEAIYYDNDGTLTGSAGAAVVPDMDILPPSCSQSEPEFSANPDVSSFCKLK